MSMLVTTIVKFLKPACPKEKKCMMLTGMLNASEVCINKIK
jgi:hypothetical protein